MIIARKELFSPLFFSTCFGSLYFLLLFFSDTQYLLWFGPVLLILYLVTAYYKLRTDAKSFQAGQSFISIGCLAVVFLLFALIPLSISIPLAISRWLVLALAGISFSVFYAVPLFKSEEQSVFLKTILCVNVLFVCLSIFFLSFDGLVDFLPSRSLVSFLVGHNHAYILFLCGFPLATYFALTSKRNLVWIVLMFLFFLGIVLSFSRFGLLFLAIEIGYVLTVFKWKTAKIVQKILQLFLGLSLLYGAALFFFSALPQLSFGQNCKSPIFQDQLCKNIQADMRLEYWRQAARVISDHPLIGAGGSAFRVLSYKYRKDEFSFTSTPHNEYLQLIVEYGLVGMGIVVLYLWALFSLLRKWKTQNALTQTLIFILCIVSADALFNFNWAFPGYTLLLATLFGITFRRAEIAKNFVPPLRFSPLLLLGAFLITSLPVLWLSGRFIHAELFLGNNLTHYVKQFPFLIDKSLTAVRSTDVPLEVKEDLFSLYQSHPAFTDVALDLELDPQKRMAVFARTVPLDPYDSNLRIQYMILAAQTDQPDIVIENAEALLQIFNVHERHEIKFSYPDYLERLITYANQLAKNDPSKAREITILAYQFEPWRVNDVSTVFFQEPGAFSTRDVTLILESTPKVELWKYAETLPAWLLEKMLTSIEEENFSMLPQNLTLLLTRTNIGPHVIWGKTSQAFTEKLNKLEVHSPETFLQKQQIIKSWQESLATIKKFGTVGDTTIEEWNTQVESFAH
ncbi:O-antigen ligase family protein [Patescibacteria group bacterium]|nr:O-antigen ligase family protein [Patescibacteria group bacterium]